MGSMLISLAIRGTIALVLLGAVLSGMTWGIGLRVKKLKTFAPKILNYSLYGSICLWFFVGVYFTELALNHLFTRSEQREISLQFQEMMTTIDKNEYKKTYSMLSQRYKNQQTLEQFIQELPYYWCLKSRHSIRVKWNKTEGTLSSPIFDSGLFISHFACCGKPRICFMMLLSKNMT